MAPISQTPRLVVRRFSETDLADFLAYQSHPEVRKYLHGEAMSREKAEAFLRKQASMSDGDRDAYHAFAVALVETGQVIGDVGMYLPSGANRVGDLGFQFHPEFHGRGYASEAAEALIRHGFTTLNLDLITSSCDAQNASSYRLMERLGMSRVAETEGSLTYELTRESWAARHNAS